MLPRLGIFVGPGTLEAAHAVASGSTSVDELDEAGLASAVDSLIAKSLVSTHRMLEDGMSYRLLETTRIYADRLARARRDAGKSARPHDRTA